MERFKFVYLYDNYKKGMGWFKSKSAYQPIIKARNILSALNKFKKDKINKHYINNIISIERYN